MALTDTKLHERRRTGSVSGHPALARGLWTPTLTPLRTDLSVDVDRCVRHVRWLLTHGCDGVVVLGTTGEAPSFSVEERIDLLDALVGCGIAPERLMVGTGCCALTDTVRLSAHAARLGCKRALVLPPFYFKEVSESGLFRSYAELIERVGDPELGLYLYHFPKLAGVPITTGLIERLLARYPGTLHGVKDSSGDWSSTSAFLAAFPDLAVFPGSEASLLDALEAGGAGCITASANVNATEIRRTCDAWREGREESRALQERITETRRVLQARPLVPALKSILAHYRDDADWRHVRPPLVPLDASERGELVTELERRVFHWAT